MVDNVRQCKICKKLFQSSGSAICFDCTDEMDKGFKKVRDYLYDHPRADIMEITKNTGVPEKWIFDFLKQERLSLETECAILTCERCGVKITTGRYCKKCASELSHILSSADRSIARTKVVKEEKEAPKKNEETRLKMRMHVDVKRHV